MGNAGGDPDREMAEKNTILRVLVGSQAYGLSSKTGGDRDEKAVCLEPLERSIGFHPFEHYEFRTAAAREGKHDAKSQDGDLDLTIYSLRKFLRLALSGNPTILEILFIKDVIVGTALGTNLQALAPHIVSRRAGKAFLGYAQAQRQRLLGEIGQFKVSRPDLVEKYGYDTKYAMHMLRLGFQGVELLRTGYLSLPVVEPERSYLLSVREGKETLQSVLNTAGDTERELKDLLDTSPLQAEPDEAYIQAWMIKVYWQWWRAQRIHEDTLKLMPEQGDGLRKR